MNRIVHLQIKIRMNKYIYILFWVWLSFCNLWGQKGPLFFSNYTVNDYKAHNRNFNVVCDSAGMVYFSNFEGVLYYDGAHWGKILTPGISRVTNSYTDKLGQIWMGGDNFLGKIVKNRKGLPDLQVYVSDADSKARIGEVYQIEEHADTLCVYTQMYLVQVLRDSVILQKGSWSPWFTRQSTHRIDYLHRIFPLFEKDSISFVASLKNGMSAVSLLGHGLVILDKNEQIQSRLNESNGLCSAVINDIATDGKGTIWGATDNGIFRVNVPSFFTHFTAREGLRGEVVTMQRNRGQLYVGTLYGLYLLDESGQFFKQLPGIEQACWQLKEDEEGLLYAATSNGLFRIEGNRSIQITSDNTFSLAFAFNNSRVLYTGEIDGIYQVQVSEANHQRKKLYDLDKIVKLTVDERKEVWAQSLSGELYHLTDHATVAAPLDSLHGLKLTNGNRMYYRNGTVQITSRNGMFRWEEDMQRFIPLVTPLDSLLQAQQWWPGITAFDLFDRGWITDGEGKHLMVWSDTHQILSDLTSKLAALEDYTVRVIYPELEHRVWIGGDFGLIQIDLSAQDEAFAHRPQVYLRQIVLNGDSIWGSGDTTNLSLPRNKQLQFTNDFKGFRFSFASDACGVIREPKYACYLEGYEKRWGGWQEATEKEYTNLSYGIYTFHVKVLDAFGRESVPQTFSFSIGKPFYLKWYSVLIYFILLVSLIILILRWRTRRLLQEKLRLEHIVEQRTLQIREQRDEIAEKSQKLETALIELNQAQEDLIRQEKEVMVGKLTQGLIDRILNPLNYIINFSRLSSVLLKDMKENLEDEQENMTEDTYEDSQEILDMMHTHLSKIEEHGNSTSRILKAMEELLSDHSCNYMPTDINQLCKMNIEVLQKYYEKEIMEYGIRCSVELLPEPLLIDADKIKLGKVILSLLQNAFYALEKRLQKSNREGEIKLSLTTNEQQIIIRIHDNGIGIERSIWDKIFDPFFTTKTTSEAAGVGLYLSREIILNHKGTIRVESEKNRFTDFIITLPIHQETKTKGHE